MEQIVRTNGAGTKPRVIVAGPARASIGGVAAHVDQLLRSDLATNFELKHLNVAAASLSETLMRRIMRVFRVSAILFRFVRIERPTILHLNPSMDVKSLLRDCLLALIGHAVGAKVYMQFHGGLLTEITIMRLPLFKWMVFKVFIRANLITVLSRAQLQSIEKVYGKAAQNLKLQSLPVLALDVSKFPAPTGDKRANSKEINFLFLGRVIPEKGVFPIVDAFKQVRIHVPDSTLTIAGDGPALDELRDYCKAQDIRNVCFAGFVVDKVKLRVIREASVFLLPSHKEGLPVAVLEAMASGIPVIVTPVGALPEIIEDGVHGFLLPPKSTKKLAEKMLTLATNHDLRENMGQACQRMIREMFGSHSPTEVFRSIYADLLKSER